MASFSQEKTILVPLNKSTKSSDTKGEKSNTLDSNNSGSPVYAFRIEYEVKLPRMERCMWTLVIFTFTS